MEKDLSDKPKSGRPPAFTEEEKEEMKDFIDENDPRAHGISASFRDCKELRRYYLLQGKSVSEDAIRNALRGMGAYYVKAQIEYREADLEKQGGVCTPVLEGLPRDRRRYCALVPRRDVSRHVAAQGLWADVQPAAHCEGKAVAQGETECLRRYGSFERQAYTAGYKVCKGAGHGKVPGESCECVSEQTGNMDLSKQRTSP